VGSRWQARRSGQGSYDRENCRTFRGGCIQMNANFRNPELKRYAVKSLLIGGVILTVVAGSAGSSSAQCCSWGWGWPCCYRPTCCYQPVCSCQPVCGCQPSCCPTACGSCCGSSCGSCSSCAAPACGSCPCGAGGCGVTYRVGSGTTLAWNGSISQACDNANRRLLPATTSRVSAPAYRRVNNQTAGVFRAPTRTSADFVARRDYGATERPVASPAAEPLPISMSEASGRY
jgi:hypothetical protein